MATSLWEGVVELTAAAQDKGVDPLVWLRHLSSALSSAGVSLPSPELAHLLVSHICWSNNVPIAWKFLDKALAANIVPPMLVIALLSARAIPHRKQHPAAYRLFLEFVKRHAFSFASQISRPNYQKIMKSIDDILHLSEIFSIEVCEPGTLVVGFVFSIVQQLLDASLDDEGLLTSTREEKLTELTRAQDMVIDGRHFDEKRTKCFEGTHRINTLMAIEIIGEFFGNKLTSRILYLVRKNMPSQWEAFMQPLQLLAAHSSALSSPNHTSLEALLQLANNTHKFLPVKCKTISKQQFHAVMASGSLISFAGQCHGAQGSALWLPIDLFLEDTISCSRIMSTSAADVLTGLVRALQAVNNTTWHDTFLGLWIAALRLVQRERDPVESPVDCLDASLCMLFSITTLAIVNVIEEEESMLTDEIGCSTTNLRKLRQVPGQRRKELVLSLQLLGDYKGLLAPPLTLAASANQAAAKAMLFLSGFTVESVTSDMPVNCYGNLWHLIVEACIARNLVDTSAYNWQGYVSGCNNHVANSIPSAAFGWSSFMKGSPLTAVMINTLVSTPASCLAELEKVYDIALNGSDDEKISAATILCGASLIHGWNMQEHTVRFIARLLSPPVPANYSGSDSHLLGLAPFLNVLIDGISPTGRVLIFSFHGLVPQLAGALMPICEVFGSCISNFSWALLDGGKLSAHAVFSNAFTLLLRLWRFNHPQLEHVFSDLAPAGSEITPEYLLMVRNCQLASSRNIKDQNKSRSIWRNATSPSVEPIFMDSFPKLKLWYQQQQACIVSTLSGLAPGNPVCQIVDGILNMMLRKINRTDQNTTPRTSGSSSSDGIAEDASLLLNLPAWDILEAVPFALDAAFTACAHGTLSPRELATGLKDLADCLPASVATIVSYFSAEVTRGVWKPAFMNGTDWPSPAANLSTVEQQIKKILTATGVDVPSLGAGGYTETALPLPLAAFISFTITYKLDRTSESVLNMSGLALSNLAACCPWPCMPVMTALWAQKAKRWSDFLILKAACTVFHHNSDAVGQLLKICFSSITGLKTSCVSSTGGVAALLGHGLRCNPSSSISPVAPGILFLRVYQYVRDVVLLIEEILSLIMLSVRDIATSGLQKEQWEKSMKTKCRMKYRQVSLAAAMTRVKAAASLGASFVWISGGLNLVRTLINETLPSRFISGHGLDMNGDDSGGFVAMLGGYALAYFAVLCCAFSCGVYSTSLASKSSPRMLAVHLEFLAGALDGKISLGCNPSTWRAYVLGFVQLMVECMPMWLLEVDVNVLMRLSKGLRQWNEAELALALLETGGVGTMGAAAELLIGDSF